VARSSTEPSSHRVCPSASPSAGPLTEWAAQYCGLQCCAHRDQCRSGAGPSAGPSAGSEHRSGVLSRLPSQCWSQCWSCVCPRGLPFFLPTGSGKKRGRATSQCHRQRRMSFKLKQPLFSLRTPHSPSDKAFKIYRANTRLHHSERDYPSHELGAWG
jgi:hypothetical protein